MSSWNGPTRIIEPSSLLLAELPTGKPYEVIIKAQVWCYNQKKLISLGITHIFLRPLLDFNILYKASCFLTQHWPVSTVLEFFQYYKFSFNFSVKKPNQTNKQTLFFSFLCSLFSKTISGMQGIVDTWILIVFTNIKIPETSGYVDELLNGSKMDLHCVTSYWVTNV